MISKVYCITFFGILCYWATVAQSREIINYVDKGNSHIQIGVPGKDVTGSYSYVTKEGIVYVVNYKADKDGYRAQVLQPPPSTVPFYHNAVNQLVDSPPSSSSSSPTLGTQEKPDPNALQITIDPAKPWIPLSPAPLSSPFQQQQAIFYNEFCRIRKCTLEQIQLIQHHPTLFKESPLPFYPWNIYVAPAV